MKDNELKHFRILTDVFLNAIKKRNYTLTATLSRFYYDAFKKEREKSSNKPVVYPVAFYELVYKTIEELVLQKDKRSPSLEIRSIGSIWLLGELQGYEISDETYVWLWRNLMLAINYEQDDMVLYHWQTAHQHFSFILQTIQPEFGGGNLEPINLPTIEKRQQERDKFLEFHYALGGLLLYKKRYSCIQRIFDYTTSEPPSYDLLPETMSEIFIWYNEFIDPFDRKYTWISSKYGFPGLNGMKADRTIKRWIAYYMAVLFLRQYTIYPYLSIMVPLDYPNLPQEQSDKKQWIDTLDFFKGLVVEALENSELINALNFNFITREWCEKNKKPYPLDFIDNLKIKLQESYKVGAESAILSDEKIKIFYESSRSIIANTISSYVPIVNKNIIEEDASKWYINGYNMLFNKDAFTTNPESHYLDFDTFLAGLVADKIKRGVAETFVANRTKSYLLKQEDIFEAIRNLGINDNYLIVAFGVNIDYYIDFLKIKELTTDSFQNTRYFKYDGTQMVSKSLFVINKQDLPNFIPREIDENIIQKRSPKKISEDLKLYASVLNLNEADEVTLNEVSESKSKEELKKSVLLSIYLSLEIRWKKKLQLVQLIEYSEFRQKGTPNELMDIKPFEK